MSEILLPCISLWNPWASWIALGWKTIETRGHKRFYCLKGKRIGIHVAKRFDRSANMAAYPYMGKRRQTWDEEIRENFPWAMDRNAMGRVICTVMVDDVRVLTAADSPAALIDIESRERQGYGCRHGLVLSDIRILLPSPAFKGKQGIFHVPLPADIPQYALKDIPHVEPVPNPV